MRSTHDLSGVRDREVVHGRADDHDVRCKKIVQVAVPFDEVAFDAFVFVGRARTDGHVGACEMQRRIGGQVPVGDLDVGVQRALGGPRFRP